nr:MAG TPA: hypothetical protein [Caudoviricetes sp.]
MPAKFHSPFIRARHKFYFPLIHIVIHKRLFKETRFFKNNNLGAPQILFSQARIKFS